jgi:dTDP-4-dehydrorhamnose reductase
MVRIAIFGGTGFTGSNIALLAAGKGWDIFIAGRKDPCFSFNYKWHNTDICNINEVEDFLVNCRPDVTVNAAAISDIDFAGDNRDLAYSVNVTGACNIAKASSVVGSKYIFLSSDAVFDGEEESYNETSKTAPVNYYGFTKAEAEKEIPVIASDYLIIRVSLILGYPLAEGNSFLKKLESQLSKGIITGASSSLIRTPVDVTTLAEAILEAAEKKISGCLHIGSRESCNRFYMTRLIAEKLGYDTELISEQTGTEAITRHPRHRRGVLDVSLAGRLLRTEMKDIEHTIERAIIKHHSL